MHYYYCVVIILSLKCNKFSNNCVFQVNCITQCLLNSEKLTYFHTKGNMNTVNPLKRPLTVPIDPLKLLVCKICDKGDVLSLKTCGCLFCDSCDGDSRDICISCNSAVDPKIKLSFTKNPRCKFYQLNQCFSNAEYKCKCIANCLVCSSCLTYIHSKRLIESCVPEILRPKVTTNHEPCQLCKEFIAEFKMSSEPYTKICFACKSKVSIPLEKIVHKDPDWNQFYSEYELNVSDKIKISETLLASSSNTEQAIKKCKNALYEKLKILDEYDRQIALIREQLDNFKKISNVLNSTIKIILELLKDKQLNLHGKDGMKQIRDLLNYSRKRNNWFHLPSVLDQIKTFIEHNSSPLNSPSSSIPGISGNSGVSVQEISDNGVEPFFILVEKQSAVNKRNKILKIIEKHQDKWVRKESFAVNDIVIILDVDATDSHKYKRAKILKLGDDSSEVSLLDFGFQTTVPNSSIGEINGININGKSTCFIAQLTGSVNLNCDFEQIDGLPKAQNIY